MVHNLKTLNAQSLLNQYRFIPQDAFSDNYTNLFPFLLQEVRNRPKEATVALLRQAKNNEYMKSEFLTQDKLSIDNPTLYPQIHIIKKVILNVYHSFDYDFKEKNVSLKIDDNNLEIRAKFDYDTVRVAMYHMFSNAVKYTAPDSTLSIKISKDNDNVEVNFTMRSLYIFPAEIESIFIDHYSGKIASVKQLKGDGVGMGLIRQALSLNGAKIDVEPGTKKIKLYNTDYGDNVFQITFQ